MVDVVSLFTGCGGSDAGVIESGFEVILANDILHFAKDAYLANLPETDFHLGTIEEMARFPCAPLLIGCYPCQGFSQGGTRDPGRRVNRLYLEFARALELVAPKAFIVENVSGMMRKNFVHLLREQVGVFENRGYRVKHHVLNASDFGVAQDRKRIFIVGIRRDIDAEYKFPSPTHGKGGISKKTIREAVGHMPKWPEGEFYDFDFHWYYLSRNRRRGWDDQSKTVVANPRHMPLHPSSPELIKQAHNVWMFKDEGRARRFSYREAAALQGFDNMEFPDTKNKNLNRCYEIVGNAVPPPLFKAVVDEIPDIW